VIEYNAKRLAIAKEMGVDVTINIQDGQDLVAEVKRPPTAAAPTSS
jgi:hypothetical protein